MARIRTVKPELFRHDGLFELEQETGLPIRLAWCALPTVCDREGRFKWKPRAIKLDCLPYDSVDFSRVLDALATRGFVVKYEVDGKEYGFIPTFLEHQVVNNREKDSILPDPYSAGVVTREPRVGDALATPLAQEAGEGKGREGKGKEGEGERKGAKESRAKAAALDYSKWPQIPGEQILSDWVKHKTAVKAKVSQTVINRMAAKLAAALNLGFSVDDCLSTVCEKGWKGFEPEWMVNAANSQPQNWHQAKEQKAAQREAETAAWANGGRSVNPFDKPAQIQHPGAAPLLIHGEVIRHG